MKKKGFLTMRKPKTPGKGKGLTPKQLEQLTQLQIQHVGEKTLETLWKHMRHRIEKEPRTIARELIKFLGHPQQTVREKARNYLIEIGSPAVPELLKALKDPDPTVRWQATIVLGQIRHPKTITRLLKALKHPKPEIRLVATYALGEISDPRAIPGLLEALEDPDENVRWHAAYALGEIRRKLSG